MVTKERVTKSRQLDELILGHAEKVGEPDPMGVKVIRHPGQENMAQRSRPGFVKGKLIVKFKSDAVTPHRGVASQGQARLAEQVMAPIKFLRNQSGLKSIRPLFLGSSDQVKRSLLSLRQEASASEDLVGEAVAGDPYREKLRGTALLEIDERAVSSDVVRSVAASPAVEYIERVPNRWTCDVHASRNRQWALHAIQWFDASRPSSSDLVIGVFDTGIDGGHPDFARSNITYLHAGNDDKDHMGHGTHVAGIIAAVASSEIGMSGVSPCRLLCVKVFDDPKAGEQESEFNFDYYANQLEALLSPRNKVRVVNLSLGGPEASRTEQDLFTELVAADILVCAAMGNEHDNKKIDPRKRDISYPAMFPDVLAVGAIDELDRRAMFSEVGKHIGLVAPGVRVLSTVPRYPSLYSDDTEYDSWPGTSMACPHVAAAAALVWTRNRGKNAVWIKDKMQKTAVKVKGMKGKDFTEEYGFGLLNLAGALRANRGSPRRNAGRSKGRRK